MEARLHRELAKVDSSVNSCDLLPEPILIAHNLMARLAREFDLL